MLDFVSVADQEVQMASRDDLITELARSIGPIQLCTDIADDLLKRFPRLGLSFLDEDAMIEASRQALEAAGYEQWTKITDNQHVWYTIVECIRTRFGSSPD